MFQTSDSRREHHADLGRASTWVKWATPTAEALRQACLAQQSRVSQRDPRLPAVTISGISLSNSKFLGPFDLEFNSQYSALIGGRGTGKSTILEYLRWALCDQPPPGLEEDHTPNYLARRRRLIDETLKPLNATVDVKFEVNGVPHTVRRKSQNRELLIKIAGDDMRPCSEEEVRRLLPIQAYSQKQLSDVSVRVDELIRFITAPIRTKLDGIEERLSDRAERIKETYAAVRRRRALTRTLEERQLAEMSLSEQADALRAGLTGLSEEDRALLDRGRVFFDADLVVESWREGIGTFRDAADSLRKAVESHLSGTPPVPVEPEREILKDAFEEYKTLFSDAKVSLDALIDRAEAMMSDPETMDAHRPWRQWSEKRREFKEAYDAAVQRSSAHQHNMEQLKAIEEQHQAHVRETGHVREELKSLATAEATHQAERKTWENLIGERDDALDEQCATLTTDSGAAIRAVIKRYSDARDFVEMLKQAVTGSRVPGNKIEGLAATITGADTPETASVLWRRCLLTWRNSQSTMKKGMALINAPMRQNCQEPD